MHKNPINNTFNKKIFNSTKTYILVLPTYIIIKNKNINT